MEYALGLIKGLGLGAGLMYLFDPDRGRRRRAQLNDQVVHACNEFEEFLGKATRDLSHRTHGVLAELGALFHDEIPDDRVLEDRVRSKLGRVVSHPRAIQVIARQGRVTLRGPILAREVEPLYTALGSVRGLTGVDNHLDVHDRAEGISALQGGVPRPDLRAGTFRESWSPATQLLVGAAGLVLALQVARRGGLTGLAVGALGVGMVARASSAISREEGRRSNVGLGREDSRRETRLSAGAGDESQGAGPAVARPGPSVRETGL